MFMAGNADDHKEDNFLNCSSDSMQFSKNPSNILELADSKSHRTDSKSHMEDEVHKNS